MAIRMNRFDGQIVMVTGGGSGIGAAVARRFVDEGARVALVDRNPAVTDAVTSALGSAAFACTADVSDEAQVAAAVEETVRRFGRLDVAVNAAGFGLQSHIVDTTLEQWHSVLNVDLTGIFLCAKHQARQMLRQGSAGCIVNISSTNAVQPGEGLSAYCAAKAGVAMFTQVAAMELAPHGIRVVAVGPGLTETPLTSLMLQNEHTQQAWLRNIPAGRPAAADELASLVAWVASSEAAYITGESIYMDGGLRTRSYPSMSDRKLNNPPGSAFHQSLSRSA
ncbi:SDR family NAD(P)-dependent oxidoreductase [Hydrogenophaga palleronii]|uniref:SDR family NAD(P)-dependent oxidoreductase n=1 Tax=Hydrogenophaga palleronii TaxID=65655 RepID=UPI000AFD9BCA|nr:SDR family NAD(P)-dependent oxidoreductase [Hydrogenophaga palleronii]